MLNIIRHQRNANYTAVIQHSHTYRNGWNKEQHHQMLARMQKSRVQSNPAVSETVWQFLIKLNTHLPHGWAAALSGIYPRYTKIYAHKKHVHDVHRRFIHNRQKLENNPDALQRQTVKRWMGQTLPMGAGVLSRVWLRGLQPARPLCPWDFPGKKTRVGCHFLLWGIFLTQGSNRHLLCLLHWQAGSLLTAIKGQGHTSTLGNYAEWYKMIPKGHVLQDSIYIRFLK